MRFLTFYIPDIDIVFCMPLINGN